MKKYDVVVVDPPWELKKIKRDVRPNQRGFDYETMTLEKIRNLPIANLCKPHALCFLWTIQKYLCEAERILTGWSFNRLLTMCWKKEYGRSNGMPLYGFRWNVEFIHVGYLNKPKTFKKGKLIKAAFSAENRGHSIKPNEFYEEVQRWGPDRIDLFARSPRCGWDVWGNEVESDIDLWQY